MIPPPLTASRHPRDHRPKGTATRTQRPALTVADALSPALEIGSLDNPSRVAPGIDARLIGLTLWIRLAPYRDRIRFPDGHVFAAIPVVHGRPGAPTWSEVTERPRQAARPGNCGRPDAGAR